VTETPARYKVDGIVDAERLRELYAPARGRAVTKELPKLDRHCRSFIALSPFVVLASGAAGGHLDASPRGGEPGFVHVRGDHVLLIPDSPGNNRLDTMENILSSGKVGLLFLVPGIDETLRVNGTARILDAPAALAPFAASKRPPKCAIEVTVAQAYLHCAKAFMRSRLWDPATHVERSVLPTTGEMLREQTGSAEPAETQAEMIERYKALL